MHLYNERGRLLNPSIGNIIDFILLHLINENAYEYKYEYILYAIKSMDVHMNTSMQKN